MAEIENKRRGRPSGRTEQGEERKRHLYQVGLELIKKEGFEKATLRRMAQNAKVSPGLFYKYYPNKAALILELHEDLTTQFEMRFEEEIKEGPWGERSATALRISLDTLKAHREALQALIPVLVGSQEENVFSGFSEFSRIRVQNLFYRALSEAQSPPPQELLEPLARLTYTAHLAVLLFWLLDRSPKQTATEQVLNFYGQLLKPLALALKFGGAKKLIKKADQIIQQGLEGTMGEN